MHLSPLVRRPSPLLLVLTICLVPRLIWAGPPPAPAPSSPGETVAMFNTGKLDLQVLSGPFFSFQPTHDARPNFDYELTAVRLGYMLDTPRGHGFFRGNDELLVEAQCSVLFQGPGTAMGGLNALYRRNFVQPGWWVFPYFGVGLGGLYTDVPHNHTERALGSDFNFNLAAELGFQIPLRHTPWAVDLAASYRHISDASLSPRNDGIDAVGVLVGVSRSF